MRTPKQSADMIGVLYRAMKTFPDLRLCQIISNATRLGDVFYVTDDVLIARLHQYIEDFKPQSTI